MHLAVVAAADADAAVVVATVSARRRGCIRLVIVRFR